MVVVVAVVVIEEEQDGGASGCACTMPLRRVRYNSLSCCSLAVARCRCLFELAAHCRCRFCFCLVCASLRRFVFGFCPPALPVSWARWRLLAGAIAGFVFPPCVRCCSSRRTVLPTWTDCDTMNPAPAAAAPAGALQNALKAFLGPKAQHFQSPMNLCDAAIIKLAMPFRTFVQEAKKKELLQKVGNNAQTYAQNNGDFHVNQFVQQLFAPLGSQPEQIQTAFIQLVAGVLSAVLKWDHQMQGSRRHTKINCMGTVITQGLFLKLLEDSTTFRLVFRQILLDQVPGPFLLDIAITNSNEPVTIVQTPAQVCERVVRVHVLPCRVLSSSPPPWTL